MPILPTARSTAIERENRSIIHDWFLSLFQIRDFFFSHLVVDVPGRRKMANEMEDFGRRKKCKLYRHVSNTM